MPRTKATKAMPDEEILEKEMPEGDTEEKAIPNGGVKEREMPMGGNPENTVMIGGKPFEIKPMELRYQRNRTAVFYHALEIYPLPDILAMDVNKETGLSPFGDTRDGDKALYDWLVAATGDEELVKEHYNDMTTETVYRILEIFRRVNRIDEREKKLKNALAPREKD